MQGKVPYEYLDHFFRQVNDFPKPHEITRKVEDVYEKVVERINESYENRWKEEMLEYDKLSWWQKRSKDKPFKNEIIYKGDPFEYFSEQSQIFREYERKLKYLQVVVDVMKMAKISKNQVWCNSYEMRALETVYRNIDDYLFLQDDIEVYLDKFL
ncbi:hypothetical protein [Vibrio phage vB_VibM_10AMN]|uniref:Uncharacterized protein n=1 Tax=Staphylococcus phage vB_VibM_10AMN12 TaxID=3076785 RepID=A0AA96KSR7_9CAUD|nr:hypothetical protein [Vibrio phage vB_VibM_10AMN]WNO47569.1 hypothetical protein [Staphylococcus phage vB_VibM_10AMN12]